MKKELLPQLSKMKSQDKDALPNYIINVIIAVFTLCQIHT